MRPKLPSTETSTGRLGKAKDVVERVVRPLFAWAGSGDDDVGPPPGWLHVGHDEHGRQLWGYVGERFMPLARPTLHFQNVEELRAWLGRRS